MASLNPGYDPSRQLIQQQQAALPAQFDAQQQGLKAQADQANQDILSSAQNRGLGFSGIPVAEQAKYNATTFMPAVANLKGKMIDSQTNLADQLNTLNRNQLTQAQGILSNQQALDEKQREFDQNLAFQREQLAAQKAQAAAALGALGGGGGGSAPSAPTGNPFGGAPSMSQRGDKGFNFMDANGQSINAVQYAKAMGVPFRDLLQQMANGGDNGARTALGFVGNDFGYDPNKVTNNQGYINLLNALGIKASGWAPQSNNNSTQNWLNSHGYSGVKWPTR